MKHLRKLLIMLCFVFVITGAYSTTVDAAKYMNISATEIDFNTVKLSWKKKSVKGYKIYRALANDLDKEGQYKFKLIATIDSKKTSYTDKTVKKNKGYVYKIVGYTYKNNKYKEKYVSDYGFCYTELGGFGRGEHFSANTSTNRISFKIGPDDVKHIYYDGGLIPDGIEILKKKNGKYVVYKKISYKKYKKGYTFVDKQVKPGKKYSYKFRAYKKVNGKKFYSSGKRPIISLYALNDSQNFTVNEVGGNVQEMIISITNNEKYGNIKSLTSCAYSFNDYNKDDETEQDLIAYSFDNNTWLTDFNNCQVKPGETIYLKIKEKSDLDYSLKDLYNLEIWGYYGPYPVCINYYFADKTTVSYWDE